MYLSDLREDLQQKQVETVIQMLETYCKIPIECLKEEAFNVLTKQFFFTEKSANDWLYDYFQ